jgi:hypothetical protein
VGVAVKVTELPRQNGFDEAEIELLTARYGLTIIVIELLVAGFPVGQTALDVNTQVIISPLIGVYV